MLKDGNVDADASDDAEELDNDHVDDYYDYLADDSDGLLSATVFTSVIVWIVVLLMLTMVW